MPETRCGLSSGTSASGNWSKRRAAPAWAPDHEARFPIDPRKGEAEDCGLRADAYCACSGRLRRAGFLSQVADHGETGEGEPGSAVLMSSLRKLSSCASLSGLPAAASIIPPLRRRPSFEGREICDRIVPIFRGHRCRHGYRRIHRGVWSQDLRCAPRPERRALKENEWHAIRPAMPVPEEQRRPSRQLRKKPARGQARATLPIQVMARDISFIPKAKGWLSLALLGDRCSDGSWRTR